jgi:hypothetical protein
MVRSIDSELVFAFASWRDSKPSKALAIPHQEDARNEMPLKSFEGGQLSSEAVLVLWVGELCPDTVRMIPRSGLLASG